jgi:hypothetical protein
LVVGPTSLTAERPTENSNPLSVDISFGDGSAVTLSRTNRPEAVLHPFTLGASMESAS